jgi:integrase
MLTGARWGELRALKCRDFDPVSGTITIAESKSGKPRRVYLTDDGKAAFESWTAAGRLDSNVIFKDRFGNPWGSHDQHRPMAAACKAAGIEPAIGMHMSMSRLFDGVGIKLFDGVPGTGSRVL